MIGAAGYYLYQAGLRGDLALNGQNNIDIETFLFKYLKRLSKSNYFR